MEQLPISFISYLPVFLIVAFLLSSVLFTVKQQTAAVIERFGKFHSIRHSGLQFKIPLIDRIAAKINLKIQQLFKIIISKLYNIGIGCNLYFFLYKAGWHK